MIGNEKINVNFLFIGYLKSINKQWIQIFLKETAIKSIQKYGVGSCGPRGFYGTIGKIQRVVCFFKYFGVNFLSN